MARKIQGTQALLLDQDADAQGVEICGFAENVMHFHQEGNFFSPPDIPKIVLGFTGSVAVASMCKFPKYVGCTSNVSFFGFLPNGGVCLENESRSPTPPVPPSSCPTLVLLNGGYCGKSGVYGLSVYVVLLLGWKEGREREK